MKCCGGKNISSVAIIMSALSVIASAIVFLTKSGGLLDLAGTQWIQIAIVLGVYANYLKQCDCGASCETKKE